MFSVPREPLLQPAPGTLHLLPGPHPVANHEAQHYIKSSSPGKRQVQNHVSWTKSPRKTVSSRLRAWRDAALQLHARIEH